MIFVTFAALGALLAVPPAAQPDRLAPLRLARSRSASAGSAVRLVHPRVLRRPRARSRRPAALVWLANWIWAPGFGLLITALLLLFPDGRLPSRRWWPAGALVGGVVGALLARLRVRARGRWTTTRDREPARARAATLGEAMTFCRRSIPLLGLAAIASLAALVVPLPPLAGRRAPAAQVDRRGRRAGRGRVLRRTRVLDAGLRRRTSVFLLPLALLGMPGRGDGRDPALPALRPRPDRQPHARLRAR